MYLSIIYLNRERLELIADYAVRVHGMRPPLTNRAVIS